MYQAVPITQGCDAHVKKSDSKRQKILDVGYSLFRAHGFDKTSMAEITAGVGGSKATLYSYFPSKEDLFVECVLRAMEDYMASTLKHLEAPHADPAAALLRFAESLLSFICSAEQLDATRLMIAESARSGTGQLFFDRISWVRGRVSAFLSACMAAGSLQPGDPATAAYHFGALLEAEIIDRLLLQAREGAPDQREILLSARRAVDAFLRAYATASSDIVPLEQAPEHRLPGRGLKLVASKS